MISALASFYFLVNSVSALHFLVLRKISAGLSLCQHHISAVRGEFPHDNLQERGLPGAVWPDQRSFFMVFNMKGPVADNHVVPERFIDFMTC